MFDILLQNHDEFHESFRKNLKESDVFQEYVQDYIKEKDLSILPETEKLTNIHSKIFKYNGDEYFTTFGNNLGFIIAKNTTQDHSGTNKLYAHISNQSGRSRLNCNALDFEGNVQPFNFVPIGLGSIEKLLQDDEQITHEISFGSWQLSEQKSGEGKVLNFFPICLDESKPFIKINFVKKAEESTISINFNSGILKDENFNISINIVDNEMSEGKLNDDKIIIFVDTKNFVNEIKLLTEKNHMQAMQMLLDDSISDWLFQSLESCKFIKNLDYETIAIFVNPPPALRAEFMENLSKKLFKLPNKKPQDFSLKPHLSIEELTEIENGSDGESRQRSNPNYPATIISKSADKKYLEEWISPSKKLSK